MTQIHRRLATATLAAALAASFTAAAQLQADLKPDGKPVDPSKTAAACDNVKLTTSMGPITIALDRAKAPISSENFAKYVKSGHYDGTTFHRVMSTFMIQGGGFTK